MIKKQLRDVKVGDIYKSLNGNLYIRTSKTHERYLGNADDRPPNLENALPFPEEGLLMGLEVDLISHDELKAIFKG